MDYNIAFYKFSFSFKTIHYVFIAIFYKAAFVIGNFFCKTAFSINRLYISNSRILKYVPVVFTECRSRMNNSRSVFSRNEIRIKYAESSVGTVVFYGKRSKIREKRFVFYSIKIRAFSLIYDFIIVLVFVICRKSTLCKNIKIAAWFIKNLYIINLRSHCKTQV